SVTDNNGNSNTCQAIINIVDEIKPTLTCPEDMLVNTEPGECGAYVSLPKAAPFDICGINDLKSRYQAVSADGTPSEAWSSWANDQSGFFSVGFYQIQWRAMDNSDNQGFCSYTLEVRDEEAVAVFSELEIEGETSSYSTPDLPAVTAEANMFSISLHTQLAIQVSPNPFVDETRIQFSLEQAQEVSLAIYNLQGQLVKQLVDGQLDAGEQQQQWDGTDWSGNRLPSGGYLVRLRIEEEVVNKKVLLLHD
nr:T9SS type A sorting domain-containing protein [Saprospiraceae bacterium]